MCNSYTLPMRAANKHTSYKKVNVGVRPSVDAPDRQTRNSFHTATPPSTTTAEKYTRRTDDEDEDGDSSRRTRQKPGRGHTETRDDDPDEDTQYSLSSVALSAPELFCSCAPLPAPRPNELRSRSCGVRGTGAVAPRPRSLSLARSVAIWCLHACAMFYFVIFYVSVVAHRLARKHRVAIYK